MSQTGRRQLCVMGVEAMHANRGFHPQPGLREVHDAMKNAGAWLSFGWRGSLIRGQQRVADHRRHGLARHQRSLGEREDIVNRIAPIEAELDRLIRTGDDSLPPTSFAPSFEIVRFRHARATLMRL
jgi:hypothetical protein